MYRVFTVGLLVAFLFVLPVATAHLRRPPPTPEEIAWSRQAAQIRATLGALKNAPPSLPPAAPDVTDLTFAEFFTPIVGARGLEYSERLRALDGHRIRICGYMVKQQVRSRGMLLLAPLPVATDEPEYGLCDELPASTLHVFVADHADRLVPLVPGILVLIGRLELGPRAESDGRISVARLFLDPAPVAVASSPTAVGR